MLVMFGVGYYQESWDIWDIGNILKLYLHNLLEGIFSRLERLGHLGQVLFVDKSPGCWRDQALPG